MPERITPENYYRRSSLEDVPYIIPLPIWILLGLAIVGFIIISVYAISKT